MFFKHSSGAHVAFREFTCIVYFNVVFGSLRIIFSVDSETQICENITDARLKGTLTYCRIECMLEPSVS